MLENAEVIKEAWIKHLDELINITETWVKEFDWSTRRIKKTIKENRLGEYECSVLIMQKELTRLMINPLGNLDEACTEYIVDLFILPQWDDGARLVYEKSKWHIIYLGKYKNRQKVLNKKNFKELLEKLIQKELDDYDKNE